MTRRRALGHALVIFLAAGLAAWVSGASPDAQAGAGSGCAFEIAGTWRPEGTAEADPIFLSFSPDGWVSLLESGGQPKVRDFAITAQAKYTLAVTPSSSLRIQFNVQRGNDLLPAGASAWEIAGSGKLLARLVAEDGYRLRRRLIPLIELLNGRAGLPKVWSL